jgi:hypothetical protein
MNYQQHYTNLILKSQGRTEGERHHIIPKCMGGTNTKSNIARLTPEEHYVAHQLLVKIYPGETKLVYAAHMMGGTRPGNKVYGWLRRQFTENISKQNKGKPNTKSYEERCAASNKGLRPYSCLCCKKEFSGQKHLFKECAGPKIKYVRTQEHKNNLGKANKGKIRSQEFKDKLSSINLGKKRSEDFSRKIKLSWAKRKAVKSAMER